MADVYKIIAVFHLISILFLVNSNNAFAVESSQKSTINRLITYSKFGVGDTYVSLKENGENCSYGYYLNKNSDGYQAILGMLLSAYHSETPVLISGHENTLWSGSKNPTCKIYAVEFKK